MQEKTLGDLIEAARHSYGSKSLSYDALAKKCGGKPTAARLQQYVSTGLKNFPDPVSIEGLSVGLNTSAREVILASARSLGLPIDDAHEDSLFINGISSLPASAQESVRSIGRELVNLARKAENHAPDEATRPNTKLARIRRAMASEGDTRSEQKMEPNYGITELHGEEARNIPVPPREQLAAHPKVKTTREKLDDETGERDVIQGGEDRDQ